LQILQTFQILKAKVEYQKKIDRGEIDTTETKLDLKEYCSYIDVHRHRTRNGLLLSTSKLEEPNPNCFVCKNATVSLQLTLDKWILQDLITKIIKHDLGFNEPTISIDGDIIWEEGDGADTESFERNLMKTLPNLPCGGIHDGTVISVEDFSQDLSVVISITNQDVWHKGDGEVDTEADDHIFVIGGKKPIVTTTPVAAVANSTSENGTSDTLLDANNDDNDDDIVIFDNSNSANQKRSADTIDNDDDDDVKPAANKRAKIDVSGSNGNIVESLIDVIEID
jgi:Ubiquitin/SUMO-activating enzyme ubiquitin-like domain